jgi:hypothetical protein
VSDEPRSPQLEGLFGLLLEAALDSIEGMQVARVVSYDSGKQTVSAQPVVNRANLSEDEQRQVKRQPEIHDVPVWFFGGGAQARITVPVGAGDYGLLVFSSLALTRWKQRGGIVDPGDDRRHDMNDCVFLPGMHYIGAAPTLAPNDAIVTHGTTRIGGPAGTEKMIRGESYRNAEDTLFNAMALAFAEIASGLTALSEPAVSTTAMAAAFTAFSAAAATYLAQKGEVL